jgi:hypothetical protein
MTCSLFSWKQAITLKTQMLWVNYASVSSLEKAHFTKAPEVIFECA